MDVKVDHNLTSNNRFFGRYSYEKTHRVLPATLPHGDAGTTFGAGDGNIKAQSFALNDTQTMSSNWLNEFRFGWSSIKFLNTSIDYGTNPANAVGLPGINLEHVDLGDEPDAVPEHPEPGRQRQPAAHHEPERLPVLRQRDLAQGEAHAQGRRQPDAQVARDPERRLDHGHLPLRQQQHIELHGHHRAAAAKVQQRTGFDVASFLLGIGSAKSRTLFDAGTYTEKRPEIAVYMQDDFRVSSKLTLNLGLRWDIYKPWVEVDNKQSNFDPTTGKFVVASDSASIGGVDVGRYLQTYSKADIGPRLGVAYDLGGDGKTIVRGGFGVFWNFSPGGTSSSKAQNQPFLQAQSLHADGRRVRHGPDPVDRVCRRLRACIRTSRLAAARGRRSRWASATRTRGPTT